MMHWGLVCRKEPEDEIRPSGRANSKTDQAQVSGVSPLPKAHTTGDDAQTLCLWKELRKELSGAGL